MKFFSNLPKTTFASSIGNFTISDFFTYLDVENLNLTPTTTPADNRSTLIGVAYQTYQDVNNFWTLLPANKTINPFLLLPENTFLFSKNTEGKINFTLLPSATATTGGSAFPVGSIILPTVGNTGACYDFGFTGNFNLNGQFAIIEKTSFYDGNMVIGEQAGTGTGFISITGASEEVTVLQKNSDGSFNWGGTYYTGNKKLFSNSIVSQTLLQDSRVIYKETVSSNPTLDYYLPSPTPVAGGTSTTNYSVQETIKNINSQINIYVNSDLGKLQSSFITAKYN